MTNANSKTTYRRLRKAIGWLGILLPLTLISFSGIDIFETDLQASISHFYYTNLREIFTGTLCAVGLFLIRYKGFGNVKWWKNDNLLTNISGGMALGVALIPTNPECPCQKIYSLIPLHHEWLGWVHYGFAFALFSSFSILALFVFPMGQEENKEIPLSVLNENNIYRTCGSLIIIAMLLVPVMSFTGRFPHSTFILEAICLFSFGIAWLIKGRALGEKGKIGEMIYREHH